jgi:hypothetical protein
MAPALTAKPWLTVLDRISHHGSHNAAALATMLYEIIDESDDPAVARIVDRHACRMLEKS